MHPIFGKIGTKCTLFFGIPILLKELMDWMDSKEIDFFSSLNPTARRRLKQKEQRYKVVDMETGEVIDHYEPSPVITENQRQSLRRFTEIDEHNEANGGFVHAIYEEEQKIEERLPDLSQADYATLMLIGTYAAYPERGKKFSYLRHDNGRYISKKELAKLTNVADRTFRDLYGKLKENGIIEEDGDKLAVNPAYFFRGDLDVIRPFTKDKRSLRVYRDTIRRLNSEFTGKNRKKLGLIYAVLPFIHFRYNVLCVNPGENEADHVTPMTLGRLAESIGYQDAKKLKQALRSIRIDNAPVFQFVEDEKDTRKRKIIVNPKVIFGGDSEALESIRTLFNESY